MTITKHFGIGRTQQELDFVDVDPTRDTPLFVDPYALSRRHDPTSKEAGDALVSFFQTVVAAIRCGDDGLARRLLRRLSEPRDTFLGVSQGRPQGRGINILQADELYQRLRTSKAVQTGFLSELADCELVIPNIGRDKISDIATNIIRAPLIRYTQRQCELLGIPLAGTVASGPIWDAEAGDWSEELVALPVIDSQRILFVPRFIARRDMSLDHAEYYRHHVLNFLQVEAMEAGSSLVQVLKSGRRRVTKKDLEAAYPLSKDFLFDFSRKHPEVLERYKRLKSADVAHVEVDTSDIDPRTLARSLRETLTTIQPGTAAASRFQHLITGVAQFLFYPDLLDPRKEHEIDEGRKRIDIVFINAGARPGFFTRRQTSSQTRATHVPFECKNYSEDPTNPEFDQLAGRFSHTRGKFGFLVARRFDDRDLAIKRCQDAAKAGRGFMLPLSDSDWIVLLQLVENGRRPDIDAYLERLYLQVAS